MKRTHVGSGTPWEASIGYARAVRAGQFIVVSSTVAADESGRAVSDDPYRQTWEIFRIIDRSLRKLGGRLEDVVRLRLYYPDPAIGDGFSRALREAFGEAPPALTGVRVTGLVEPEFLLEIEAEAVVPGAVGKEPDLPEWDEEAD